MEAKTKKIMFGSFCAGAVFALVGFWLFEIWWGPLLGAGAGIVIGYVSYDARKFLSKVPEAFRLTMDWLRDEGTWLWRFGAWWKDKGEDFSLWYRECHHMINAHLVFLLPLTYLVVFEFLWSRVIVTPEFAAGAFWDKVLVLSLSMIPSALALILGLIGVMMIVFVPLQLGAMVFKETCSDIDTPEGMKEYVAKGRVEKEMTYLRLLRWWVVGCLAIPPCVAWFVCYKMWTLAYQGIREKGPAFVRGLVCAAIAVGKFFTFLVRLTHCRARVICALFGTGGGAVGFLLLAPQVETLVQQAAVVVFCGLIGMAVGLLEYKVVAIRWLKIVPNGNGG